MSRGRKRRHAHVHGARRAMERRGDVGPVSQLPGFEDSLRLLIERERYALTDIGLMFGVSRERVRQLAKRHGLTPECTAYPRGLFAERVWNDATHRFEPVAKGARNQERERQRAESVRAIRARVREGYLAHLVAVVRGLAGAHPERRVSLREVGALLRPNATPEVQAAQVQNMARWLARSRTNAEGWAAVLRLAEAAPALVGTPAHRNGYGDAARLRPALARELVAEGVPAPLIGWALGLNGVACDSRIRRLLKPAP